MQAQNTLYYVVKLQKNNNAVFVHFSFATVLSPKGNKTVTSRIAHYTATLQANATTQDVTDVVAAQQKRDNAAQALCCNNSAATLLARNDEMYAAVAY
jgi:hypothetical protein